MRKMKPDETRYTPRTLLKRGPVSFQHVLMGVGYSQGEVIWGFVKVSSCDMTQR